MNQLKTRDLRPCDGCGGAIQPFFYRLTINLKHLMIDRHAVNEVLGTTQILGGNFALGESMSPNRSATLELPTAIEKDIFLCPNCVMGLGDGEPYEIRPLDMLVESENTQGDDE